jgi:hypothetical protein
MASYMTVVSSLSVLPPARLRVDDAPAGTLAPAVYVNARSRAFFCVAGCGSAAIERSGVHGHLLQSLIHDSRIQRFAAEFGCYYR